jgi:hypothetical protein
LRNCLAGFSSQDVSRRVRSSFMDGFCGASFREH